MATRSRRGGDDRPAHRHAEPGVERWLHLTPAPGFIVTETFPYTANDGTADSAPATVTITVGSDGIFKDGFEDTPGLSRIWQGDCAERGGSGRTRWTLRVTARRWTPRPGRVILVNAANEIVGAYTNCDRRTAGKCGSRWWMRTVSLRHVDPGCRRCGDRPAW